MEIPNTIIYPYFRGNGYIYLHLPKRLTKQCGVISGIAFAVFIKDNRILIEQAGSKREEELNAKLLGNQG